MQGTSYVKYAVNDLNQDGLWELVVLRADEEGNGIADYYCWQEEEFQLRTSARITSTMAELSPAGACEERCPAGRYAGPVRHGGGGVGLDGH